MQKQIPQKFISQSISGIDKVTIDFLIQFAILTREKETLRKNGLERSFLLCHVIEFGDLAFFLRTKLDNSTATGVRRLGIFNAINSFMTGTVII